MRSIAVVTSGRADYDLLFPLLRRLRGRSDIRLSVVVTGSHLSRSHGMTVRVVERDGFHPIRVRMTPRGDAPSDAAEAIGRGVVRFARLWARLAPDWIVLLGDRIEILAAACAALPMNSPFAHLCGGEGTEGLIDEAIRHAVTKMAHLHLVAHPAYARRIMRMGEEPWRVHVVGSPGLENARIVRRLSRRTLERIVGMPLSPAPLLVTLHPETLSPHESGRQAAVLLRALATVSRPILFTGTNIDPGSRPIRAAIDRFTAQRPDRRKIESLGRDAYHGLLRFAAAMVGNSSSGIIEAPTYRLPVVNIGIRQAGRIRAPNVIDVPWDKDRIVAAIRRAVSPGFRRSLRGLRNPYGDGRTSARVVRLLLRPIPRDRLLVKRFHDGR